MIPIDTIDEVEAKSTHHESEKGQHAPARQTELVPRRLQYH